MSKCSLAHQLLPKDQQTKPEEVNYPRIFYSPHRRLMIRRTTHTFHLSSKKSRRNRGSAMTWKLWSSARERSEGSKGLMTSHTWGAASAHCSCCARVTIVLLYIGETKPSAIAFPPRSLSCIYRQVAMPISM